MGSIDKPLTSLELEAVAYRHTGRVKKIWAPGDEYWNCRGCNTQLFEDRPDDVCETARLVASVQKLQDICPMDLARLFHKTYEELAPKHSWETQKVSRVEWVDVPNNNRALMVEVATVILEQLRGKQDD